MIDGVDSCFFFVGSLRLLVCFRVFILSFALFFNSSSFFPSFHSFRRRQGGFTTFYLLTCLSAVPFCFFFSAERGGVDDILLIFSITTFFFFFFFFLLCRICFFSEEVKRGPWHFTYLALPYSLPFFPEVGSWEFMTFYLPAFLTNLIFFLERNL